MTYKRIFPAIVVLATVLTVAFIACGDDEPTGDTGSTGGAEPTGDAGSAEDAELQLCEDLAELGTAAQTLNEINETNTFNELEAAQDDVDQAVDDVRASAANVAAARIDEVDTARTNLEETVSGIEGRDTIGDAQTEVSSAASDILAAVDQLNESLSCPATQLSPSP